MTKQTAVQRPPGAAPDSLSANPSHTLFKSRFAPVPTDRHSSAEGGTRTPTGVRPLRPERSASTNSTTSAGTSEPQPNIDGVWKRRQGFSLTGRKWFSILDLARV